MATESAGGLGFITVSLDKIVVSPHEDVSCDELGEPEESGSILPDEEVGLVLVRFGEEDLLLAIPCGAVGIGFIMPPLGPEVLKSFLNFSGEVGP